MIERFVYRYSIDEEDPHGFIVCYGLRGSEFSSQDWRTYVARRITEGYAKDGTISEWPVLVTIFNEHGDGDAIASAVVHWDGDAIRVLGTADASGEMRSVPVSPSDYTVIGMMLEELISAVITFDDRSYPVITTPHGEYSAGTTAATIAQALDGQWAAQRALRAHNKRRR